MWRTVEYTQTQSRGTNRKKAREPDTPLAADGTTEVSASPPSQQQVNQVVKDLRRTAHALRSSDGVVRDVLLHCIQERVLSFLTTTPVPTPTIRIVGLGIGQFSRSESRISFLQMATLLAIRDACTDMLDKSRSLRKAKGVDATAEGELLFAPTLETSFFEPMAAPLHHQCCEALGVGLEKTNVYGAYSARALDEELVILFMPHSPWVLLHNTWLHNWTAAATAADEVDAAASSVWRMKQLIVVGNDMRGAPMLSSNTPKQRQPWSTAHDGLISSLSYHRLVDGERRRGARRGKRPTADENDDEDASHVSGLSFSDCADAFSDTSVMYLQPTLSDEEVAARLKRVKSQPLTLIKAAPELF